MTNVFNLSDHKAFTCDCGSVNFSLLMSEGIECNQCGKRQPFKWRELDAHECPGCGGAGRTEVYRKVPHQLGSDELPFWEQCDWCVGTGWLGSEAEEGAAINKESK